MFSPGCGLRVRAPLGERKKSAHPKLTAIALAGLLLAGTAQADQTVVNAYGSRSIILLGSKERRWSVGVSVQNIKPEKRFSFGRRKAEAVYEAYAERNYGDGFFTTITKESPREMSVIGGMYGVRYRFGRTFVEGAWGLQYASRTSYDTDSFWNSTPTIGVGYNPDGKTQLTLRMMHVSNGGTRGHNKGQNRLTIMVGFLL